MITEACDQKENTGQGFNKDISLQTKVQTPTLVYSHQSVKPY